MPRFHSRYPEVRLKLFSADRLYDFARDNIDAAIRPGTKWPGCNSSKILPITLSPVCSPDLIFDDGSLMKPHDLSNHTIIRVAKSPDDWEIWSKSVGLTEFKGRHELVVDNYSYAWQLAGQGVGVTIGRFPLIENSLVSGQLVALFPDCTVNRKACYQLIWPKVGRGIREVQLLRRWLSAETALGQFRTEPNNSSYRGSHKGALVTC